MKFRIFIIVVLSLLVVSACSGNDETSSTDETEQEEAQEQEEEEKEDGIEVDKGLLNVEITLPEMFFEDENIEEMIEEAKGEGVKEIAQNEDGTVTFKMSKKEHKEMLREMADDIEATVEEIRSEEHTSELQSRGHLVCRLLL